MFDGHWMGGGLMWLFWILLFVVFVWLWRFNYQDTDKKKSAMDILKERYAKGEIDQDEYMEKKKHLSG